MASTQETARKSVKGTHHTSDQDISGRTALHRAAENGDTHTVASWQNKDTFTVTDNYGRVPMHCAAANGHEEIVLTLLEATDVDQQDKFGRTALQ